MKKSILSFLALASLSAFAHYAVFSIGKVKNASGNITLVNKAYSGKTRIIEFKNLGTKEVLIHHMRFNEPQESVIISADELIVGPGKTVREVFFDTGVILRSVDFFVEGETELLEVYGVIQ